MPCILSIHKIKFVQNVYLGIIFFVLLILNIFSILPLSCLTAGQYLPPFLPSLFLLYFLENVPECHSKASPLLQVPSILTLFFLDNHRGSQKEVHQFFSSVLNKYLLLVYRIIVVYVLLVMVLLLVFVLKALSSICKYATDQRIYLCQSTSFRPIYFPLQGRSHLRLRGLGQEFPRQPIADCEL